MAKAYATTAAAAVVIGEIGKEQLKAMKEAAKEAGKTIVQFVEEMSVYELSWWLAY